MEKQYAFALWRSIEKGETPKKAVQNLISLLERDGKTPLLPKIVSALKRIAESHSRTTIAKLFVAREKDAKHAKAESGEHDAEIIVDETLIGGWRLEKGDTLVDASHKQQLLTLYQTLSNA